MPDVSHAGRDVHVTHAVAQVIAQVIAYVTAPQHNFARRCSVMIRNLLAADRIMAKGIATTNTIATGGIAAP
jgi:hypothetical protein